MEVTRFKIQNLFDKNDGSTFIDDLIGLFATGKFLALQPLNS